MATAATVLQLALDISHLVDVLDVLKACGFPVSRWLDLGLRLGLLKTTLDAIKRENQGVISDCMMECLSKWLQKADNVVSRGKGPPTWDSLSDAVRAMNEIAVADKLDQLKYTQVALGIFNNALQIHTLYDILDVARLLNYEKVISDTVLSKVTSTKGSAERRKVLLAAVKESIQTNHCHLQTFAFVLIKFTANVKLGRAIHKEYEKLYCTNNKEERFISVKTQGEASDSEMSTNEIGSPLLTVSPSTQSINEVEIPVPQSMSENFDSLRSSFARMFFNVRKVITNNPPPLEDLKLFLEDCYRHLRPQLANTDSLKGVLRLIEGECTVINIEPLNAVIEEFEITEAEKYIDDYRKIKKDFCKNISIRLCLKENFDVIAKTHPPLRCETATYVFDWEPDEYKLHDIKAILSKASGKLVKIKYIKVTNSISITCTFPHSLIGAVISKSLENLNMLKKNGLIELTVGCTTIWKRGKEAEVQTSFAETDQLTKANSDDANDAKPDQESIQILTKQENYKKEEDMEGSTEVTSVDITDQPSEGHQLSEMRKELLAYKRTNRAMLIEIDQLKERLKGVSMESKKQEILTIKEQTRSLSVSGDEKIEHLQVEKKGNQDLALEQEHIYELTELESLQLYQFAMIYKTEDHLLSAIFNNKSFSIDKKLAQFLQYVKKDPFVLAELIFEKKSQETGEKITGSVTWSSSWVWVYSPSPSQCREVILKLTERHWRVGLWRSSADMFLLLIPSIVKRQSVKRLWIRHTSLTLPCLSSLSLSKNSSLQELLLHNCSISDDGVSVLCNDLRHNMTLLSLNLHGNTGITSSSAISELLLINSTISYLCLHDTSLSSDAVLALFNSLTVNTALNTLELDTKHMDTFKAHPQYQAIGHRLRWC